MYIIYFIFLIIYISLLNILRHALKWDIKK